MTGNDSYSYPHPKSFYLSRHINTKKLHVGYKKPEAQGDNDWAAVDFGRLPCPNIMSRDLSGRAVCTRVLPKTHPLLVGR